MLDNRNIVEEEDVWPEETTEECGSKRKRTKGIIFNKKK